MDGFFLVNKRVGDSSNYVVQQAKKKLRANKVGHLGTLDPLASGLLILAINRATKFSSYFLESEKFYQVQIELGTSTDTDDSTGKIISKSNSKIEASEVKKELYGFLGKSLQVAPFFSALKHKGKPLYKYAREGVFISKPAREISIKNIDSFKLKNKSCTFNIHCTKGTYIRSIARDLGTRLGCGAHMKGLIRTRQNNFNLCDAVRIEDLTKENIISIDKSFEMLEKIVINLDDAKKFVNGVTIQNNNYIDSLFRVFNKNHTFLGIGEIKNNDLKHKQLV